MARLLQLPVAVMLYKVNQAYNDPLDRFQCCRTLTPRWHMILRVRINPGQMLQVHPQPGQIRRISRSLQRDYQLLHRLHKRLRRLQLINNALHMGLVCRVAVK